MNNIPPEVEAAAQIERIKLSKYFIDHEGAAAIIRPDGYGCWIVSKDSLRPVTEDDKASWGHSNHECGKYVKDDDK